MIIEDAWKILGIDPTKDENEIRTAYRTCVVKVNPEDDPEGFKQLREAYDMAMASLNDTGKEEENESEEENKDEIDIHIDKADEIYSDIFSRRDEDKWREWLKAPIVNELDTADKLREKFLAYCMGHFEFPHNIWKLFDGVFNYRAEHAQLAEIFPKEYLDFIIYQTEHESFLNYNRIIKRNDIDSRMAEIGLEINLESKPGIYEPEVFDTPVDVYIKEVSFMHGHIDKVLRCRYSDYMSAEERIEPEEERKKQEDDALEYLKAVLNHLKTFDIFSPIELAGILRVLFLENRIEEAVSLAEIIIDNRLLDDVDVYVYSTAMFVLIEAKNILGTLDEETLDKCDELADRQLEIISESIMALQVKGQIRYYKKDYEKAGEFFIKALDINSRNNEAVMLLRRNSDASIDYYNKSIETGEASESDKLELAWSYFRMEKTEETLQVLDTINADESIFYGYNNLYGRCFYNEKEYEKAYPYLTKWVEMIEAMEARKENGEKLSDKDEERLTRIGFCYYMIASCAENLDKTEEAVKYYKKSVEKTEKTYSDINELLYYQENYGKLLMDQGRLEEAMGVWNNMIERIDHCVPAYVHRQKTAFEMKDAQLVIDDYYNIIRDVPQYPDAYVYAAKVFDIYNQKENCESVLKRAEEAGIESDRLQSLKARLLSKSGESDKALNIYKEIDEHIDSEQSDIFDDMDKVEFYADMATLLMNSTDASGKRNRLHEAEEYVKKGRKIDENNKRLFWIMTDVAEWNQTGAEKVYEKMLELFPEDAFVDYEYGEYFNRNKDVKKAEQCYMNCLKKDSRNRSANNKLMNIYQTRYSNLEERSDYDKAVSYATAQLENDDDDYYYVERALLYLDGYDFDAAFEDASKALEKNPGNVYAYNACGLARMRVGRFKEALEFFDKAIAVMEKGETANPYMNAAKCCETLGEYEKAIHYLEVCRREHEYNSTHVDMLARINLKLRRFEITDEYYKENERFYIKKRKETNNTWYDLRILKTKYRRAESWLISGNYSAVERIISEEINAFLRENGYLAVETYLKPKGNDRKRIATLYKELADFYNFTRRYNKKAIHFYEESLRYWCPEDQAQKKGIMGMLGVKKELPRPEAIIKDRVDLDDIASLYANFAYVCFMSDDKQRSEELAKRSLECIIKGYGSPETYLNYPPLKPQRIRVVAIDMYLQGNKARAFEMLDSLSGCMRCYYCYHENCYEQFLYLARIYEMEGDKEKALDNYKKAFQCSPDDSEVYQALKDLEK